MREKSNTFTNWWRVSQGHSFDLFAEVEEWASSLPPDDEVWVNYFDIAIWFGC